MYFIKVLEFLFVILLTQWENKIKQKCWLVLKVLRIWDSIAPEFNLGRLEEKFWEIKIHASGGGYKKNETIKRGARIFKGKVYPDCTKEICF